jgi:hypothetical protein
LNRSRSAIANCIRDTRCAEHEGSARSPKKLIRYRRRPVELFRAKAPHPLHALAATGGAQKLLCQ